MTNESIAYFSMKIALEPGMPTYRGGLVVWLNTPLPPMEASGTSGMTVDEATAV